MLAPPLAERSPTHGRSQRSESGRQESAWTFLCPDCRRPTAASGSDLVCPEEGRRWSTQNGIYPLLSESQRRELEPFLSAYRRVRRAEGWGGDREYYLNLPFCDLSGRHPEIWKIRARSFLTAMREIHGRFGIQSLRVLELGAGNCWFSARLVRLGHNVLATDVHLDEKDGLGAFDVYHDGLETSLVRAQADMESLPLEEGQFDLVVANGSFHYAGDLRRPIGEAYRVLKGGGLFLVLDSPVYRRRADGEAMVARRVQEHRERYGVSPEIQPPVGFLVLPDFVHRLIEAGFSVSQTPVFDGIGRALRRRAAPWMGWTPPAEFVLFSAHKRGTD